MRFESTILGIGVATTLGFAVTGALAGDVHGLGEALRLHLLLGLGFSLGMLFAHLWVAVFLVGTGRGLARSAALAGGAAAVELASLVRRRRTAALLLGGAVAAALAVLWSGGAIFSRTATPGVHATLFWAALALQLAALVAERRALAANTAAIRLLDGLAGSAPRFPDPA